MPKAEGHEPFFVEFKGLALLSASPPVPVLDCVVVDWVDNGKTKGAEVKLNGPVDGFLSKELLLFLVVRVFVASKFLPCGFIESADSRLIPAPSFILLNGVLADGVLDDVLVDGVLVDGMPVNGVFIDGTLVVESNELVNGVFVPEGEALLPNLTPLPVEAVPVDGADVAKVKGKVDGVSFTPVPEQLDDAVLISCVSLVNVKTHGAGFVAVPGFFEADGAVVISSPPSKLVKVESTEA